MTLLSSGANRARKNSGWIIENTTENGSRSTGFSSRVKTMRGVAHQVAGRR